MIKLGINDVNLLNSGNIGLYRLYLGNRQIWPSNGELWTPAQISTGFWYDASDATTFTLSGLNVAQWRDKSGNNRHMGNTNPSTRPSYIVNQLNGLPIVDFLSSNTLLSASPIPNIVNGSYYIVFKAIIPRVIGQAPLSFEGNPGSTRNSGIVFQQNNGLDPFSIPKPDPYIDYNVVGYVQPASTGTGQLATWNGGTLNGTFTYNTTGTFYGSSLALGLRQVGFIYMNCQIAEVVISLSVHDINTRQRMEGYLAWKWGLDSKLPINHPYKNNAPTI